MHLPPRRADHAICILEIVSPKNGFRELISNTRNWSPGAYWRREVLARNLTAGVSSNQPTGQPPLVTANNVPLCIAPSYEYRCA